MGQQQQHGAGAAALAAVSSLVLMHCFLCNTANQKKMLKWCIDGARTLKTGDISCATDTPHTWAADHTAHEPILFMQLPMLCHTRWQVMRTRVQVSATDAGSYILYADGRVIYTWLDNNGYIYDHSWRCRQIAFI